MPRNHIRVFFLVAFSAVFVAAAFAQDSYQHPRIISVVGTAEIKVPPDEVQLTLGIDSHDKDLVVAKTEADQRIKKLLTLAHAAGIEAKNIKTSALTMGPEYSDEKAPRQTRVSSVRDGHCNAYRHFKI